MVFTYITWRQRFLNIHNVTLQRLQKDWKHRSESKVLVARNLEQYFRNARTGTLREWIPGNAYSLVWNLTHHYNDVIMSAMAENVTIWWRHHVQYWRRHFTERFGNEDFGWILFLCMVCSFTNRCRIFGKNTLPAVLWQSSYDIHVSLKMIDIHWYTDFT